MYEVLQRNYVICTTESSGNAIDIARAMRDAYPSLPFSWREAL